MSGLHDLPADLPQPVDDGACNHVPGTAMPDIALVSTEGRSVDLSRLGPGRTVLYCYPRTGVPGEPLPTGWDAIPGARGCTPQSCAFRDHAADLARYGARVFGLSTQDTAYQREMAARLHLPFEVLSDAAFAFADAVRLPTFEVDGMRLIKRLTLIVRDNAIEHVFYPVFPPERNASDVAAWLADRS
ncbi:peroxiredoxin [Methyloceanibacter sp.]|uniref:peroxiredoxin n=1 Tax=Methyloceanibacter sp. TaxID=1965321 RepID=UPI002BC37403|nr:peroxiredoxin [Methyloceanibacter sp.]HML91634.1 peroxiredoxin [Methyloceanibacter sp.]